MLCVTFLCVFVPNVSQQDEITVDTVLDSLKAMQEQLREKNQKYNEMKQRFETSNEVI